MLSFFANPFSNWSKKNCLIFKKNGKTDFFFFDYLEKNKRKSNVYFCKDNIVLVFFLFCPIFCEPILGFGFLFRSIKIPKCKQIFQNSPATAPASFLTVTTKNLNKSWKICVFFQISVMKLIGKKRVKIAKKSREIVDLSHVCKPMVNKNKFKLD